MAKELDINKMLLEADKGMSPSTLGKTTHGVYGITPRLPSPQPKQEPMPPPKSHAPKGMGNSVHGDLGAARGVEASRAFENPIKKAGRTGSCAKPLTFRKPKMENDQSVMPPRVAKKNSVFMGSGGSYVG